jgi:hypothetical protein
MSTLINTLLPIAIALFIGVATYFLLYQNVRYFGKSWGDAFANLAAYAFFAFVIWMLWGGA